MDTGYGKCYECRKFGSTECPPSFQCMRYDYRPYFEPKEEPLGIFQKLLKKLLNKFNN